MMLVIRLLFFAFSAFTIELNSIHFQMLAPHHIQQDRPSGCSLATAVVMLNGIKSTSMTQDAFRNWLRAQPLPSKLKNWAKAADYGGWGVTLEQMPIYLIDTFQRLGIKAKIDVYPRGKFNFNQFISDLSLVNERQNTFMLINYPYKGNGHWSPLGAFNKESGMMDILNVDSLWKYGQEISFPKGKGVDTISAVNFYNKWGNFRGYLKITLLE